MTRFDAATPAARRELYRDGIAAHRDRPGGVLTVDADDASLGGDGPDPELGVPWIQYEVGGPRADGRDAPVGDAVALDCTDDELDRLKGLVREYPEVTIGELTRPDDAEGTHVRMRSTADADRLAALFEDVFQRVYGLPEDARVWVTSI